MNESAGLQVCHQTGSLVLIQGFSGKRAGSGVAVVSVAGQGPRE